MKATPIMLEIKFDSLEKLKKYIMSVQKVESNPIVIIMNVLAVMISWYFNHSIIWAIIAYIFGPLYLLYSLIVGRFVDNGFITIMESYF